jgi:predicted kinase
MATRILALGTSVVFDFAANTTEGRAWVRSIFEAAGADHVLHVLDVSDEECKRRVRERNATRPAGLYFGDVSDALVDAVLPHIVPPVPEEGFTVRSGSPSPTKLR